MTTGEKHPRDVVAAWALTGVTALAGYLFVVAPANREAAAANARLRLLVAAGDRDEGLLRRAAASPDRDSVRAMREFAAMRRTAPQTTLAALQGFARDAARHHVAITNFAPNDAAGRKAAGRQDVTLSLRGRYADVLNAVAALASGQVLFEIRGLALTQSIDQMDAPGVEATLEGALFASPTDVSDSGRENQPMAAAPSSTVLRITHDPFDAQPPALQEPQAAQAGGLPPLPGGEALPPNVGAGVLVLRAVVDGRPPRALVEIGDRPIVVRVGSRLGWATVTAISPGEVRLDDGRTLRLAGAQP